MTNKEALIDRLQDYENDLKEIYGLDNYDLAEQAHDDFKTIKAALQEQEVDVESIVKDCQDFIKGRYAEAKCDITPVTELDTRLMVKYLHKRGLIRGCEWREDEGYFDKLVSKAKQSAQKASVKFPQPNYVALKIAEEAGEVVRGCVHYAENRMDWEEVEGEIIQLMAMIYRLVYEGDMVNGIHPPKGQNNENEK